MQLISEQLKSGFQMLQEGPQKPLVDSIWRILSSCQTGYLNQPRLDWARCVMVRRGYRWEAGLLLGGGATAGRWGNAVQFLIFPSVPAGRLMPMASDDDCCDKVT